MRVRLVADMSGTRDGQPWPPAGSVVDLPDDEARALVAGNSAVDASEDVPRVMVPPMGVHTPGALSFQEPGVTHLVEAPADAVADPEGARQAIKDRNEGNVTEVPVGAGVQARDGSALSPDAVEKSVEAEKLAREAAGAVPMVGSEPAKATHSKASKSDK